MLTSIKFGLFVAAFTKNYKGETMLVQILKSKLLRAEATDARVDYEGSLAIDQDLMDKVGMLCYEKILVGNIANGKRFETYAIPAERGGGAPREARRPARHNVVRACGRRGGKKRKAKDYHTRRAQYKNNKKPERRLAIGMHRWLAPAGLLKIF